MEISSRQGEPKLKNSIILFCFLLSLGFSDKRWYMCGRTLRVLAYLAAVFFSLLRRVLDTAVQCWYIALGWLS